LRNNTQSNFFDFNLNRGSDYLFQQRLIGRSENSGIFSQQYIVVDGGLKSRYNQDTFSNSQIYTANTSTGVWNWLEVSKIRFTVTTQLGKIYNFFRRDFL